MSLGFLGLETMDWQFLSGVLNIVFINLILSGDNAVIIALAVRPLDHQQRRFGILVGSGAAVVFRILLTFFISQILTVAYVKLVGGLLILWIAVKLFLSDETEQGTSQESKSVWQALWIILVADITMSLDNVLAIAAASHGNHFLIIFGLTLSIPVVVFSSGLLSMLMDRYPIILYLGAAVLGRVGAEMIFSDPSVEDWLAPSHNFVCAMEAFFALAVIIIGKFWLWYSYNQAAKPELVHNTSISVNCSERE